MSDVRERVRRLKKRSRPGRIWPFIFLIVLGFAAALFAAMQRQDFTGLVDARLRDSVKITRLVVYKKERLMVAFSEEIPVKAYRVALSRNPVGRKRFEGDGRVPEGQYRISGRNERSRYHKNLLINYPTASDRAYAQARGEEPGGDISIHGQGARYRSLGRDHWKQNWTDGCIAVTDDEIDELFERVTRNAPITIVPGA